MLIKGMFGGFQTRDLEKQYTKTLFFLLYSLQNALSNVMGKENSLSIEFCILENQEAKMLLSMGSLRFIKNMITDLATMDVRKMEKPLFSGALGDLYQKLRAMPEL